MTAHDRPDFVSVAEAARILGISRSSIKRRIAAGTLEAEQLQRAQGVEYRVRTHRDVPVPPAEPIDSKSAAPPTGTLRDDPAAITAAVAPLLERLAIADTIIAGHTVTIREQAEIIGTLRAELGTAHARIAEFEAPSGSPLTARTAERLADPAPGPLERSWRLYAPWLLTALAIVVAAALLTLLR
jgi:hypothetical protein